MTSTSGSVQGSIDPPNADWTAAEEELDWDFFWGDKDKDAVIMADQFGLQQPLSPVMRSSKASGGSLYMVQSADKSFYIWNLIEDAVWKIVDSDTQTLDAILSKIKSKGLKEVKVEAVRMVH
ncbi:hypothetical protein EYZ11_008790 [Aspergillus tanneri]|uniref:Uncharacterized protein n=1 Tax=Aspergillus tanneri TaxID=1220188 RepID=A0A4S3J9J0_9EURO|nr:uncharacterized protein ATNIH1004_005744 [Aspergillus tanneri]KAA8647061.1 hypothetical protein ATNIH1004_005744 [Aspergillus tanneri]THC91739.1 hypothetical protein EYZ11_008790 [Aspergillus tanneri]